MDTVAAIAAPPLVDVDPIGLDEFLGLHKLRVVQVHAGRPFGWLLKGLLHGTFSAALRCARLEASQVDPDCEHTRRLLTPWTDLAGTGGQLPPPAGYYLLRGKNLLGFHPEPEPTANDLLLLAGMGVRGLGKWLRERDTSSAGRAALDGLPELDILSFFQTAACGTRPQRAPAAGDRRRGEDRRQQRRGPSRRALEQLRAELEAACDVLGVTPDMPLREIKRARSRLMRERHPDRVGDDPALIAEATQRAVRINAAWAAIRKADTAGWL